MRRLLLGVALAIALLFPASVGAEEPVLPASYHTSLPMRMDQAGEPQCVVFAGTFALDSILGRRFSTTDAWRVLVSRGEAGPQGTTALSYLEYAKTVGLLPLRRGAERVYRVWRQPDGGTKGFHYVRQWSNQPASHSGSRVRIRDYVVLDHNDPLALQRAILAYGPILVSLPWYNEWVNTRLDGTFKPSRMDATTFYGLHEVVLFGWKTLGGALYWDVANSWGELWGYKGVGFMPDAYRQFGDAFAVIP